MRARQHRSRVGQVVPGVAHLHPAGGHRPGGLQVVPGTIHLHPADRHDAVGVQVIPGPAVGQPAGTHDLRRGIHVVPVGATVGAVTHPAAHEGTLRVGVHPLAVGALEETGHHVAGGTELVVHAIDREPAALEVVGAAHALVPPADRVTHPVPALGVGARRDDARIIGVQVNSDGLGVVQAVVPGKDVRVRDEFLGGTLLLPAQGDVTQGHGHVHVVLAVGSQLVAIIIGDVAVEPQAGARVVHGDAGDGRIVAHVNADVGATEVALMVHDPFHDRGRRIDAEVVGDGLLGGRGPVVVRGDRQLVVTVGQVLELVGRQVQEPRCMLLLHRADHSGGGVQHRLPVLMGLVGGDDLAGPVGVGGRHRVDTAQRSRLGVDGVGSIERVGAGDNVLGGVGAPAALAILRQGVVAEDVSAVGGTDRRGQDVSVAIGGKRIEDRGLAPVTVEAQVGHGQVGLPLGTGGEAHETLKEGAGGGVVAHVASELATGRHVDADGGLARGRDGDGRALAGAAHGRAGVGDRHATASPVGGMAGEEPALNDLGERLRVHLVGRRHAGEVVEGDVEVPARRAVAEVRLGAGGIGGAHDGWVHGRGRGRQDVHQARSLLARGVVGAGVLEGVDDGGRRAHEEVLDDVRLVTRVHRGEQRVGLDALQDERAGARQLRGRHRRAGHEPVGVLGQRGVNVAAGRGHLGLEAQVRGHAPRGEV